ncbi:MAG: PorT family protein [Lentimicrobium sp.]|nr:PorT family protein [Lentimicrobium sp.]
MRLKNLTTTLFIALLLTFLVSSQTMFAQYKAVSLGVKAAPNLGWFKSDQQGYESQGTVAGFSWGLVAEFYFAENYAFATGFNFDFQNGKLSYPEERDGIAGTLTRNYRLKYLEIPAMIKMKTNEIKGFRFFGQIGLGTGVRLSSKGEDVFEAPGEPTETTDFRLIDSQTTLFRASMIVGAGLEYPFDNSSALVVGFNFNNGFTNALKGNNTVDSSLEHNGIPNFIELSIAVMF